MVANSNRWHPLSLLICFLLLFPALRAGAESKVHERQLANGLRVLVKEDHRAPIVTSQVWYRVGSSYEHGGLTGISHVLEHMMFKGTDQLAPGEFSRIIAENGGDENAFTSRDYTAYYQTFAADRLPISFELEAQRMRALRLTEAEFRKELAVVQEERRWRTEDDPESLTFEYFNATAYMASPYRIPVIGWASDLENLRVEDLRRWYRRWYAPNNATLVVVGDVDPEAVFALAERYFGPLQPEDIQPPKGGAEPPQRGEKRIQVRAPAKEPYLLLGYQATALGHGEEDWEPYALEMLASVLDGGSSARLSRELVRGTQIAASAGASYNGASRLPGLLLLDGIPGKGHDIQELEQALRRQVQRLREEPVTQEELARIRTQLIAAKIYERDSVYAQAVQLGRFESLGLGWRLAETYVDHLRQVTPEQIQAVARKYLRPERLTVATLVPQPLDHPRPGRSHGGLHDVR